MRKIGDRTKKKDGEKAGEEVKENRLGKAGEKGQKMLERRKRREWTKDA